MLTERRQRLSALIALVSIVAILLAACVPVATEPAAGETGAATSGQKVKVVYWAHDFMPRAELDKKYIAEFMEKNPDIEVEYDVVADFDAKLRTALAAGTGPDLFAQWNGDMGTFYAQDTIAPVNAEVLGFGSQKELMDLYVAPENTLQGAIFDGQLYGIPNEVSIYACYVNKALFADAGLDPDTDFPATWEQMVDVSEKLTKRDADGKLVQRGFDFDWSDPVWMLLEYGAMVRQLGGSELEPATPENEKAMQFWVDWAIEHNLGGPGYQASRDAFLAGTQAIVCSYGSWAKSAVEEAKIDYAVMPVPIWENAVNQNHFDTYAYFHMVNAHAAPEVQAAAWKLAWALDSHPIEYMVQTGLLQPQLVLQESQEFKDIPNMDLFLEEMTTSMYSPRIAAFNEVAAALARARDRCVVEGMSVQESLNTAQEEIDQIMADSGQQ